MKPSIKNLVTILILMILVACTTVKLPTNIATPTKQLTPISSTASAIPASIPTVTMTASQNSISPSLLAEWDMGNINDMAWSPNSNIFVVDSEIKGKDEYNIQAFDVKSLNRIWVVENILSNALAFNQNGQFVVESPAPFTNTMEVRRVDHGDLVKQIQSYDCGIGQFMLLNPGTDTFLTVDTSEEGGLNARGIVSIYMWNIKTGLCNNLLNFAGFLYVFDVNSNGTLIAYGGVGPDDHTVIWDETKQTEVCEINEIKDSYYGKFIPNQNVFVISDNRKISFIDDLTCKELRELNFSLIFPTYLAFSSNGQWLAIANHSVQILETSTGKMVGNISLPEKVFPSIGGLAFSPDNHYLLITFSTNDFINYGDKIQLWQLRK